MIISRSTRVVGTAAFLVLASASPAHPDTPPPEVTVSEITEATNVQGMIGVSCRPQTTAEFEALVMDINRIVDLSKKKGVKGLDSPLTPRNFPKGIFDHLRDDGTAILRALRPGSTPVDFVLACKAQSLSSLSVHRL